MTTANALSRHLRNHSPFIAAVDRKEVVVTSRDVSPHWAGKRDGTPNYTVIYCATVELRKAIFYWLRENGFAVEASGVRWVIVR